MLRTVSIRVLLLVIGMDGWIEIDRIDVDPSLDIVECIDSM